MENDLLALYDKLIEKSRSGELNWTEDANGTSLATRVGDLVVKVGGLALKHSAAAQATTTNAFRTVLRTREVIIVVYDAQTRLVARGIGGVGLAAYGTGTFDGEFEDISSPKIFELATILESRYRRYSVTSKLLQTLKAS